MPVPARINTNSATMASTSSLDFEAHCAEDDSLVAVKAFSDAAGLVVFLTGAINGVTTLFTCAPGIKARASGRSQARTPRNTCSASGDGIPSTVLRSDALN